jgi:hypothetical protein
MTTTSAVPTFTTQAIDGIARYQPDARQSLGELQKAVAAFHGSYRAGYSMADDDTLQTNGATAIEAIQSRLGYIQTSHARRLTALLSSLVDHVNARRLLDCALAARAAMEFAGSLAFYERKLRQVFDPKSAPVHQVEALTTIVDSAIRGGRFDWAPFIKGGADLKALVSEYSKKDSKPAAPPVSVKNTLDFVTALEESVVAQESSNAGAARTLYAVLCDICHPAVGGHLLYVAVPQRPGWVTFGAEPNEQTAAWFLARIVIPASLLACRAARHSLLGIERLGRSLQQDGR